MKRFNRSLLILLLAILLGGLAMPAFASGRTFALDPYHTQVHFTWNHLGFSRPSASVGIRKGILVWNGEHPGQSSIRVTIPIASIDTQVPALNAILQSKFFDAKKYPVATFRSTSVERVGQLDVYRIKGLLTLHGATRLVILTATLNKYGEDPMLDATAIGFSAVATIKRSEFGLGEDLHLAGDKVQIRITAEAVAPEALAREKRDMRAGMMPGSSGSAEVAEVSRHPGE